ncbi:formate/nitrite transporter family protein [Halocatena salina]|uniref:Formate/nitrite transporter family protein n=1 Tax=Halocatena salina TaxID=2934340 RepID=A0A8U0A5C2_9EURY|nr:formate/nitrite transporter family protein [Halocatena salina]UPM44395.1 formate/nitrite transporter family protein [Halocatena salina]
MTNKKFESEDSETREAIDRAASGAPAAGWAIRDRFSSDEIFQRLIASADEEIATGKQELIFSGFAAGFAIVLSFIGYAVGKTYFPHNNFLSAILYPLGFMYIILGRYQLYTENTLPPVVLVLTRLASVPLLIRVWTIVLIGNVLGAGLGSYILANTHVLSPQTMEAGAMFAKHGLETAWWDVFFKSLFAGWLVAGVVWLGNAARDTIARLLLIYIVFYTIAVADLFHVITAACDVFYFVFVNGSGVSIFYEFWLPVLLGNTVGGVFLVGLVNFAQVEQHPYPEARVLSPRELLFSWKGGQTNTPAHSTDEESKPISE